MATLKLKKLRHQTIRFELGADYSADILTSDIRVAKDDESELIATWTIDPETDGTDGVYLFTLDDADLPSSMVSKGFMDVKRVSAGEPLVGPFDGYITVVFQEVITP